MNDFILNITARLNKQLSKHSINGDLKSLDNSMYVKVIAKLSKALSEKQLKKELKALNNFYIQVGTDIKIDNNTKTKLQSEIKQLQSNISDLYIGLKVSKSTRIDSEIDFARRAAQKRVNTAPISFNLEIKKQKLISDIEYLGKRYSKLFSSSSASEKFDGILDSARMVSTKEQLYSTRDQLSAFTSELKANGLAAKSTAAKWGGLVERSKELFSAATIITTVFSQVKQAVSSVIKLDTAMTNVYKVQNDITSRDQFSPLLKKWNKLAQELSVTTESLLNSSAEWSKIGFNLDMSEQLSRLTAIFEKTAELSNQQATSTLISAAQAFTQIDDLGEEDYIKRVESIGNKVNSIGNKYAISSQGIAEALQNSSAALRMANNDLDEAIALIATANKIFQSPDEVGNMLKVVSARVRGQKGELEALNEDTEGLIEGVSKVQTQILNLTHNKVNIFEDDNETLKSTYEIMKEVGGELNKLTDKNQASLLEILFGKQRMSSGASLLLNYQELEQVKSDSMNAANSMADEYAKYMESAEAHITTFKEKLVETYNTFMSGDTIKFASDIGSATLDLVNQTDLLRNSLLAIASIYAGKGISSIGASIASTVKQMNTLGDAVKQIKNLPLDKKLRKNAILKIADETKNLTDKNLKLLLSEESLLVQEKIRILRTRGLTKEEAKAKLEKMGLTGATNAQASANAAETVSTLTLKGALTTLRGTIRGVGVAMKAAFLNNPIGFTLTTITTAITLANMAFKSFSKDSLDEIKEHLKDTKNEFTELKGELDNTNSKLEENKKLIDDLNSKDKLTYLEKGQLEELKETTKELERQRSIQEIALKNQADKLAKENKRVFQREFKDDSFSENDVYQLESAYNDSPAGEMELSKQKLEGVAAALIKAQKAVKKAEYEGNQDAADAANKRVTYYKNALEGMLPALQEYRDNLSDVKVFRDLTSEEQTFFDNLENGMRIIYSFTNPNEWNNMEISDIFKTKGIEKTKEELVELVEAGKLDKDTLKDYPILNKAIEDSKLLLTDGQTAAEAFLGEMKALVVTGKEAEKELSSAKTPARFAFKEDDAKKVDEFQTSITSINNALDKLNKKELNTSGVVDLIQELGLDPKRIDLSTESFAGLKEELEKTKELKFNSIMEMLDQLHNSKSMDDRTYAALSSAFQSIYESGSLAVKTMEDWQKELQEARTKIADLQEILAALDKTGLKKLDAGYFDKIISTYPQLAQYLNNEKQLHSAITKEIKNQKDTASNAYVMMMQDSQVFYSNLKKLEADKLQAATETINGIVNANSGLVNALGGYYNSDLKNFKTLQEAKAKLEETLIKNSAKAWAAYFRVEVNNATKLAEVTRVTVPLSSDNAATNGKTSDEYSKQWRSANAAADAYNTAIKELDKISKISIPTSVSSGVGNSSKNSGSAKEFSQNIDWAQQSLDNLMNALDELHKKLDNTSSWEKQLKIQDQIIKKQNAVTKAYKNALNFYQKQYKKSLSALGGNKKFYQGKIESGSQFTVQNFTNEKTYEKVKAAQDAWNQLSEMQSAYQEQVYKKQEESNKKKEIQISRITAQIDDLKAKLDNTSSAKNQNKILDDILKKEKQSYQLQKQIAGTKEEKNKLEREYKKLVAETAQQEFNNLQQEYDNKTKINEEKSNLIQADMDKIKEQGYSAGTAGYEKLISLTETELKRQNELKKKLTNELNDALSSGQIKKFSEEWYAMTEDIYETENSVKSLEKSTLEFNNALRSMQWDAFDGLMGKFDALVAESNFLIGLMDSDKLIRDDGSYTDNGKAVLGQHAANYDVYMQKAKEAEAELNKLDENSLDQNVIERRQQLLELQQQSIASAMNEKQAMLDLAKEGIQAQIDAFEELTNKQKEALDAEKELHDYQKNLNNQKKEMARIEKQLNALEADDSDEAKKKRRELEAKKQELTEQLSETEYDKSIEDQKKSLDETLENYKKSQETYMEDSEQLFSDTLVTVNSASVEIGNTLKDTAKKVGYAISDSITSAWGKAGFAVTDYSKTFQNKSVGMITAINSIKEAWTKAYQEYEKYAAATISGTVKDYTSPTSVGSSNSTNKQTNTKVKQILGPNTASKKATGSSKLNQYVTGKGYKQLTFSDMVDLAKAFGIKGITNRKDVEGESAIPSANRDKLLQALKKAGFSKQGRVELGDVVRMNGDDVVATAKVGEEIISEDKAKMISDAADKLVVFKGLENMPKLDLASMYKNLQLNPPKIPEMQPRVMQDVKIENNIEVSGAEITDVNSFVSELASSKKFRNLVIDTALDPLVGKDNSYMKYIRR